MSRCLLVGVGPMPGPVHARVHATGLRLLTFLRALAAGGHGIALAEIPFSLKPGPKSLVDVPLIDHTVLAGTPAELEAEMRSLVERIGPEVIVALTDVGALAAVRSGFRGPIYVDYFGHPMAERQQLGFAHGSDASLAGQWLDVLPVLLRADRFSVCSASQRLALIGELGAAGRLNSLTCGHELIDIIPPAIAMEEIAMPPPTNYLESIGVERGARTVLSTGGFNTWFDEATLFHALQKLMSAHFDVHFVATGGAIEGHVEVVFERFRKRVASSSISPRVHLVGWVPHNSFLSAGREAVVGVNVDTPTLEGELGCRNRLLGWLWLGLRVVTTVTSDATRELANAGLVHAVRPNDSSKLSEALLEELDKGRRSEVETLALRRELEEMFGTAKVAAPASKWAARRAFAPDRPEGHDVANPLSDAQRAFLAATPKGPDPTLERRARTGRELAERLRGSRLFQLSLGGREELATLIDDLLRDD